MQQKLKKNLVNTFIRILIKKFYKDKPIIPSKYPFEVYEIFQNINENKIFDKKIILPYENEDFHNMININKPYEVLEIEEIKARSSKKIRIMKKKDIVIPLAILNSNIPNDNNQIIKIVIGDKVSTIELKYSNRFHYLPINNATLSDSIEIFSDSLKLSLGKPIYRNLPPLIDKPRLIVQIFIDALAYSMIEKFGYEIMPNTKEFFESGNGTFFNNSYAQSEWTLSSIAGIFTGKYTNEHLIYHPRKKDKIKDTTLADVLQNEGYLTFACTNVPKLKPINGFDKGFDRYIQAIDKDYNYIINEAHEQLDSFGGNQYLFLGFFDNHESHTLQPISSQVSNKLNDFKYKKLKGNSKDLTILYDSERINMFKNSIRHLDKKLNRLYNKINEYDKEALVVLHSDHGVNFMTQTKELLSKEREKVVFLYKNNKSLNYSNEIKEIRELPSMICKDLKLKDRFDYQQNGYSLTESIYPDKEYEIAVRDNRFVLFFKVNWIDIKKRNSLSYLPKASFHYIDNESLNLDIKSYKSDYNRMYEIADNHYKKICKNLINQKK